MRITLAAMFAMTLIIGTAAVLLTAGPERAPQLQVAVFPADVLLRPGDAPNADGLLQQNVGEDDGYPSADRIELRALPGEAESVQLLVDGPEETAPVDVIPEALEGPNGAQLDASLVRVSRALTVPVDVPSDLDLGGATGDFWDPLVPRVDTLVGEERNAFPFLLAEGPALIWVDIVIPDEQAPGDYTGELPVTTGTEGSVVLPVRVRVEAPAAGDAPTELEGAFDLNTNVICETHRCDDPGAERALQDRYATLLESYGIPVSRRVGNVPDPPSGAIAATDAVSPAGVTDAGDTIVYAWCAECMADYRDATPAGRTVAFHCDEMGVDPALWTDCAEAGSTAAASWQAANTGGEPLVWQATTSLPNMRWAAAQGGEVANASAGITRVILLVNQLHDIRGEYEGNQRADYDRFLAESPEHELWMYVACASHGCDPTPAADADYLTGWPQYTVDAHPSQLRATPWLLYRYNIPGEYHYDTVRDLKTAFQGAYIDGGVLDGTLMYPGIPGGAPDTPAVGGDSDIPLASIRLARLRDGREDYELLARATSRSPEATAAIARSLFPEPREVIVDAATLQAARQQLLDLVAVRTVGL